MDGMPMMIILYFSFFHSRFISCFVLGGFGVRGLKWHRLRDRKDRCAGKEEKEGGETI